ncbi:DUF2157 domain-containing protein [Brevifollis gellanilyticus]|uniref:DUF2157 domain-containing protein n=1 Tax=Brevifollis gellanilyticus TaxID=748831 RepID=A0A512M5V3_9BACT|nr:DUF2157 domain-containing protein [Brevifollis gellanilyticus]GEP41731.1 hypothetical protein BGE01nite_10220 [Brevifollis gellanilyticus]
MSAPNHRWLHTQLPEWEREGLITAENAVKLRQRHPHDDSGPGIAQVAMGVLGALLIGVGLIAIIGYNWDHFNRPVRLMFAFAPLLGAQAASWWALKQGDACARWIRETAAFFQAMAAGACIAIVSQIYNLGGDWPQFVLAWALLSLPLAWLMRSYGVVIFYLVCITVWSLRDDVRHPVWYESARAYPLLLLGLFPFWPGWKFDKPLSTTLRWAIALSASMGLAAAAYQMIEHPWSDFEAVVWLWSLTAAAMILLPISEAAIHAPTRSKPQVVLGFLYLLPLGVIGTSLSAGHETIEAISIAGKLSWTWVLIIVTGAFAVHAILRRRWAVLSVASLAVTPALALAAGENAPHVVPWLMLVHLSLIGLALIALEFLDRKGAPRLGAALLSVLIMARLFDSDLSLLLKGLAFILVGVAFLVFNIVLSRHHKKQKEKVS